MGVPQAGQACREPGWGAPRAERGLAACGALELLRVPLPIPHAETLPESLKLAKMGISTPLVSGSATARPSPTSRPAWRAGC